MVEFVEQQGYPGLFLALLIFGYPALLPSLYLATQGGLSLGGLFALQVLAALCSDTAWYAGGRLVPLERLSRSRALGRVARLARRLSRLPPRSLLRFLFASRFLYGAKQATNVLCGSRGLSYWPFLVVNAASVTVVFAVLLVLVFAAGEALTQLLPQAVPIQAALWGLVVLGVVLNLSMRRFANRRLSRTD